MNPMTRNSRTCRVRSWQFVNLFFRSERNDVVDSRNYTTSQKISGRTVSSVSCAALQGKLSIDKLDVDSGNAGWSNTPPSHGSMHGQLVPLTR
jgi:hypothetical protein